MAADLGHRQNFLKEMVLRVRREISLGYYEYEPPADLCLNLKRRSFARALTDSTHGPAIVLELKRLSPGHGETEPSTLSPEVFVRTALDAGADALSVIPQPESFMGSIEDFATVSRLSPLPVLFKDFVISAEQVDAARACGASAVLLLARLEIERELEVPLASLVDEVHRLGMEAVVEVHGEEELEVATGSGPDILGVNSRDLASLDIGTIGALSIIRRMNSERLPVLAMSGVKGPDDVRRYAEAGAAGVLVGSSFMRATDRVEFARSLKTSGGDT